MAKIKCVLLDLDHTMYDYNVCNNKALSKVFDFISNKFKISNEEVKKKFYDARESIKINLLGTASSHSRLLYFKKLVEMIENRTDPELSINIHDMFWKEYFSNMQLFVHAKKFLDYCKAQKIKIVIITDLTAEIQLKKIAHLGISDYIDFVITSEEVGAEKPSKRIFYAALDKLNCSPDKAVMIGDDIEKDISGAEKLGIKAYKSFDEVNLNEK